ncbi:MAG: ATPase [Candidatus Gracilibacteria bacterium]|nr:ATPase [Candidatus Gracilibacteria bacterium]
MKPKTKMAQVGIREYDAKKMYFESIGKKYTGLQIDKFGDVDQLDKSQSFVIKPDMLFGKRGKYGLVGVGLTQEETVHWLHKRFDDPVEISGVTGNLTVFLVEEYIPHIEEYYLSFSAEREYDVISFSIEGGVEIEDNWDKVQQIQVSLSGKLTLEKIEKSFGIQDKKISDTILSLWKYYKTYGFVYLEINPFCFHRQTGELVLLDMVAKIDDQEYFQQKNNWKYLEVPNSFGFQENQNENFIRKLDQETGASLKFKVLNPQGKIWTLLAGGGGSLVMTDTLGALGFADEIGNYGELSGNPNRDFTKAYTRALLEQMLENGISGKYLIIAGAIANFTDVAVTFAGIIDILEEKQDEILEQKVKILVRRGGINEKKGLELIKTACQKLGIPCQIADSTEYMTDILKEIKL